MRLDKRDHKPLVLWATACAEHVLPHFEESYTMDNRPRKALEAGRAWVRSEVAVSEVRAAGHAAATADVGTHAAHAANCAVTAATAATADPTDSAAAAAKERDWQYRRLPKHFRLVAFLA
jgi:hypothetical protein